MELLLVGGGHAHALVLLHWTPMPGLRLTLVNPEPAAPYTGMLPGHVAGHYRRDEMMIDLRRLARAAGARFVPGRVVALDRGARQVRLADGRLLGYDLLSIDIGISSDLPQVPGADAHGVAAKPLGGLADRWAAFVARPPAQPRLVVIGGGTGGVELAMAAAHRLRQEGTTPEVSVLERGGLPLPGIGAAARRALLAQMHRQGVALRTGAEVVEVGPDHVRLAGGERLAADLTLLVAGARPQDWPAAAGLAAQGGFIAVGPTLQSSDPRIFAAGDCAHLSHAPRPKAGVFAVREAPVLRHNLRAAATRGRLRPYHPQRDYLKLVSCGGKLAVADRSGLSLEGHVLWRWKDRIDRRFMAPFHALPPAG